MLRKTIINERLRTGADYQYYAVLKDKAEETIKLEAMGTKGGEVTKKFDEKTKGKDATHTGVLYHSNGNIYRIAPADAKLAKEAIHRGQNDALLAFAEYFIKTKKLFTSSVHSEKEASIWLETEWKEHLLYIANRRKEIAQRITAYGEDLMQNFNGTGYRFLKAERFYAGRYNLETGATTHWGINAWNMDSAYQQFGRTLMSWGKRNYANTGYQPEEYFLFGNDRMLLTSLEVAKPMEDGTNIT